MAIAGPLVLEPDGTRYPSARRFPSLLEGAGHAIAGRLMPHNRFSRRYRMTEMSTTSTTAVDWVSGSCMLVRRKAFEELGGFDESYFMYGEDVDLCWRAHRAGYAVAWVPSASVTHVGGISTRRTPYRMLAAHHRSALRFASRSFLGLVASHFCRSQGYSRLGFSPRLLGRRRRADPTTPDRPYLQLMPPLLCTSCARLPTQSNSLEQSEEAI